MFYIIEVIEDYDFLTVTSLSYTFVPVHWNPSQLQQVIANVLSYDNWVQFLCIDQKVFFQLKLNWKVTLLSILDLPTTESEILSFQGLSNCVIQQISLTLGTVFMIC